MTTNYQYNGFGDLKQLKSPDNGVTQYTPNAAGSVQTWPTRAARQRRIHTMLGPCHADRVCGSTIAFTYDQGTNGKGHLTNVSDGSGSTHWTFTPQGRVATKQQVAAADADSGLGYNAAGQMNQVTTPSGQVIGYSHSQGRSSAVTLNGSPLLGAILYEPFGPTRGWTWSNSTLAVREYDLDGRLTTVDSAGLSTYQLNPDGTIQSSNGRQQRTRGGLTSGLTEIAVDEDSNRLQSSTGTDARMYSYDAAGNITNDGTRSFTYNDAGRMASLTKTGTTTTYALNGLGQRVRKTTSSASVYFAYDEVGHLLGEYDERQSDPGDGVARRHAGRDAALERAVGRSERVLCSL